MKRYYYFKGVFLVLITMFILSTACVYGAEESITVTTYYPSPYGVYSEMRLYPKDDPTTCDNNQRGLMYYDATANQLRICTGTPPYQSLSGYWAASPSPFNPNNIYNTNSGNVGIGTNNPQVPLHIFGDVVPGASGQVHINNPTANRGAGISFSSVGIGSGGVGIDAAGDFKAGGQNASVGLYTQVLTPGASPRVLIDTNGNVGIGTTNTFQHRLYLNANTGIRNGMQIQDPRGHYVSIGGGIGTDGSVSAGLHIGTQQGINIGGEGGTFYYDYDLPDRNLIAASTHNVRIVSLGGDTAFSTGNANVERMRITNGGNVGIGTTGPWKRLDVQGGSIRTGGRIGTQNFDPDSGYPGGWGGGLHTWDVYAEGTVGCGYSGVLNAYMERNGSAYFASTLRVGSGLFISGQRPNFFLALQGDRNMVLYDNGIAVWNSGTWVSDIRLKKDVQPLGKTLDKIKGFNTVKFILTNDESNTPQLGLIAQEIEQVFPELVYTDKNSGYKLIYYDKLSAILLQAVKDLDKETADALKEQRNILEEQKKMIESLKKEVDVLKNRRN